MTQNSSIIIIFIIDESPENTFCNHVLFHHNSQQVTNNRICKIDPTCTMIHFHPV